VQKLNFHIENSPLGVIEWDCDLRVTRWSTAAEDIFGWKAEEILGQRMFEWSFVFPDDFEIVNEVIRQVFEQRTPQTIAKHRNYAKDGSVVHCEWYNSSLTDESGNLVSILSLVLDVSDRHRLEAERDRSLKLEQSAREQAETANRIKDEFLAVLSHELRSPLNPILGWSKLLQTRKFNETKTAEALAIIERNARLQAQLIEDLLDVSRILRGKLTLTTSPVNLVTPISAAIETVRLASEAKAISLKFDLQPSDRPVLQAIVIGDPARLQQILWNLLANAVKFTPEGGHVEIRLVCTGSHAQIRVSDTGQGISADFLPYVFDYFRQADSATTRRFGGLGLGLAIVRQLVELHGGTILADSPGEGQGATFTVSLPLAQTHVSQKHLHSSLPVTPSLAGLQILIVDDDPDSREFVAFVVEQEGATVTQATSAAEALELLRQTKFAVLLSDVGMPEMDGYMLLRHLRSQDAQIPAIALTAYAGEVDQQQALAAGFQLHLSKPVEPDELINAILKICNRIS
jgi:PAS domain S-box-containing protein